MVLAYGEQLSPAAAATQSRAASRLPPHTADVLYHVLLALVSILLLGRWLGKLFVHFGQPRVIGEMVAGIMLGPSLLGPLLAGGHSISSCPPMSRPTLGIIAQIGVILYMFLVGLELNAGLLRSRAHATVAISHTSILVPFLLGAILALWLYPHLRTGRRAVHQLRAVHGRGDVDHGLSGAGPHPHRSPDGEHRAGRRRAQLRGDRRRDGLVPAGVCRRRGASRRWAARCRRSSTPSATSRSCCRSCGRWPFAISGHDSDHPQRRMAVWVLVALLFSAMTAEWIGIHAIFGAFLLGAIIPHDADVALDFRHKLEDIVKILLLPAFFAYTGMRTQIGLVSGWQAWMFCAVIILVATLGKFGGTFCGRPVHRPRLAAVGGARHAHEHAAA